jgi:hypothetical protein
MAEIKEQNGEQQSKTGGDAYKVIHAAAGQN